MTLRYLFGGAGGPGYPENASWARSLGMFWSHEFAERIIVAPDHLHVWMVTKSGSFREFEDPGLDGIYQTVVPADEYRSLEWLGGSGWALHELDGTVTNFLPSGLWSHTTDRNGKTVQGTYSGNNLVGVAFPDGRSLTLAYASSGKLASIVESPVAGTPESPRTWTYSWLASNNYGVQSLQKITLPDGRRWDFAYDNQVPPHLTRVRIQQAGGANAPTRVEGAWEYDATGQLWHAWRGAEAFASGWDKYTWNYVSATETQVEDAYGNLTTYLFEREPVSGKPRVTSVSSACPTCGLSPNSTLDYDNPANPGHPLLPWTITDSAGTVSELTYTDFGQVDSRTEALNDPQLERTTSFAYDPTFPAFATSVERPSVVPGCASNRVLVRSYDPSNGNLDTESRNGCQIVAGATQPISGDSTVYDYSGTTAGAPTSVDPPGFSDTDVTGFDFDDTRGDQVLLSRTDPLVGQTFYGVDGFNRRVTVTDVNNVVVSTAYDSVDRVISVTRKGETVGADEVTSYFYNAFGDLFCVKLPRSNGIEYTYDTGGRRTAITRGTAFGSPSSTQCLQTSGFRRERTSFTFNPAGQVLSEQQESCATGTCSGGFAAEARTEYVRSSRCHLDQVKQAKALTPSPTFATTEYKYDCNGNLEKVWDANHPSGGGAALASTRYKYDDLNRMVEMRQPWGPTAAACDLDLANDPDCAITTYGYDLQDHLTSVTDPEGNVTTYVYDDRDLLTSQQSAASGLTQNEYNLHHELTKETDARGIVTNRSMDAADRIDLIDYTDDSLDVDYVYGSVLDPVDFTNGRLKQIVRNPLGATPISLTFKYDRFGRKKQEGDLARTFDKNGNTLTLTYPSSVVATYFYDFADREQTLSVNPGTASQNIVTASAYKANGPLSSVTFGSSPVRIETRGFDARYLPTSVDVNGSLFHWDYLKDDVGNIGPITQTVPAGAPVRSFGYQDYQYFLTSASGPWAGPLAWSYDKIGNRLTETRASVTDSYAYIANGGGGHTPLLDLVTLAGGSGGTRDYSFGPAGHLELLAAGANTVDFDNDLTGQLGAVSRAIDHAADFLFDGRGFLHEIIALQPGSGGGSGVMPFVDGFESGDICDWSTSVGWGGPQCPIGPVESREVVTYDSAGRLYSLRPTGGDPQFIFYFAGRPVATYTGGPMPSYRLLTTDHLGTPALAFGLDGLSQWVGGFEPFGKDFTIPSAASQGIFLRLPGQWNDGLWNDGSLGTELYYNVHRWYESGTGRYGSPDPLPLKPAPLPYLYAASRPTFFTDSLGLAPVHNGSMVPIPFKPEDGDEVILCLPGQTCDADGVYPPTCSDFPIKIVSGCNGVVTADGKLQVTCPFFNPDAPKVKEMFPRLGQRIIGGRTDSDFHQKHPDWPVPNGKPYCGCEPPTESQAPPGPEVGSRP